jgi:hypothetical protein
MVAASKLNLALVLAIPDTPAINLLSAAEAPAYTALPRSDALARSVKLHLDDLRAAASLQNCEERNGPCLLR